MTVCQNYRIRKIQTFARGQWKIALLFLEKIMYFASLNHWAKIVLLDVLILNPITSPRRNNQIFSELFVSERDTQI